LLRIARRPFDRLLSVFHPVHRYQCIALECAWQGNLPHRDSTAEAAESAPLSTMTGTSRMGTPRGSR
jgi:hypothetical protein